jgi:hypothetical protein
MLGRTVFALAAVLLLVVPAIAQDCPAEGSGWEGRQDAVRKAPTCNEALKVAESCAYGATGDVGLTTIVMEKCQAVFLTKLSKSRRRTYDRAIKHCGDKYKNERHHVPLVLGVLPRDPGARHRGAIRQSAAAQIVVGVRPPSRPAARPWPSRR